MTQWPPGISCNTATDMKQSANHSQPGRALLLMPSPAPMRLMAHVTNAEHFISSDFGQTWLKTANGNEEGRYVVKAQHFRTIHYPQRPLPDAQRLAHPPPTNRPFFARYTPPIESKKGEEVSHCIRPFFAPHASHHSPCHNQPFQTHKTHRIIPTPAIPFSLHLTTPSPAQQASTSHSAPPQYPNHRPPPADNTPRPSHPGTRYPSPPHPPPRRPGP